MKLDMIRELMRNYLKSQGVEAVCAWPEEPRTYRGRAVVAVSMREMKGGPAGFQDYLGEQYDRDLGRWVELYGSRTTVRLGLDLWGKTAAEVHQGMDRLSRALHEGHPEELRVQELTCGEIRYDGKAGLYCCPAETVCELYLYAVADEGGAFLDFEVRGKGTI